LSLRLGEFIPDAELSGIRAQSSHDAKGRNYPLVSRDFCAAGRN
jgi:hypothetical protein